MILLRVSGELKSSIRSSSFSFLPHSLIGGLGALKFAALLTTALVLFPVKVDWAAILGVLTTNDDIDRSFLLTGEGTEGVTSGAVTFFPLGGKIFALMSCRLWSGLHKVYFIRNITTNVNNKPLKNSYLS